MDEETFEFAYEKDNIDDGYERRFFGMQDMMEARVQYRGDGDDIYVGDIFDIVTLDKKIFYLYLEPKDRFTKIITIQLEKIHQHGWISEQEIKTLLKSIKNIRLEKYSVINPTALLCGCILYCLHHLQKKPLTESTMSEFKSFWSDNYIKPPDIFRYYTFYTKLRTVLKD
jgi:hypothetical protein